ncbi:MAG: RDD family protein [Candidatus Bathyarchaeia archaeon]
MSVENRSSTQVDFGHWLLRFIALLIDSIPLTIIAYVIFWFAIAPLWWAWILLFPLLYGIFALLYFIIMEVTIGATVGKKILGLEVQMTNGSKVTFDKSFIRNISKLFGIFLILDWLVAIITPGPDPRQKYTDRIAGTTVVSVKQVFGGQHPPPPPPPPPPSTAMTCASCSSPLRYIQQYQRWYCDKEQKYA